MRSLSLTPSHTITHHHIPSQYKPNLSKSPHFDNPDVSDLTLSALSDRFATSLSSTDDFVAALTLFALYRFEHQVPSGYRAYSMGMSLGMKDVLQNVAKIRRAALSYEVFHGKRAETVWELLDAETEYHSKLPKVRVRVYRSENNIRSSYLPLRLARG